MATVIYKYSILEEVIMNVSKEHGPSNESSFTFWKVYSQIHGGDKEKTRLLVNVLHRDCK